MQEDTFVITEQWPGEGTKLGELPELLNLVTSYHIVKLTGIERDLKENVFFFAAPCFIKGFLVLST